MQQFCYHLVLELLLSYVLMLYLIDGLTLQAYASVLICIWLVSFSWIILNFVLVFMPPKVFVSLESTSDATFHSDAVKYALIGLMRDLRGIAMATKRLVMFNFWLLANGCKIFYLLLSYFEAEYGPLFLALSIVTEHIVSFLIGCIRLACHFFWKPLHIGLILQRFAIYPFDPLVHTDLHEMILILPFSGNWWFYKWIWVHFVLV